MSIISKVTYQKLWEVAPKLMPTTTRLRTYSGQHLVVLGTLDVKVRYEAQQVDHSILVVEVSGPSLFGRDLLAVLKLNWKSLSVHHAAKDAFLNEVLAKHETVFSKELGKAKNIEATLNVEAGATPRYYSARSVPYALSEKIERKLDRLQKEGIIEPITFSEWAAPIVPVSKQDGSVRICGDYKLTVNKVAKPDSYPLPRIEDLFARLAGGKHFSKLDIAHVYQQIPLSEDSKQYVTINTHKGLFRYSQLPSYLLESTLHRLFFNVLWRVYWEIFQAL